MMHLKQGHVLQRDNGALLGHLTQRAGKYHKIESLNLGTNSISDELQGFLWRKDLIKSLDKK